MFKLLYPPNGHIIKYETGDKLYIATDSSDVDFPYTVCGVFDDEETILEYFETIEDAQNYIDNLEKEVTPPMQSLFFGDDNTAPTFFATCNDAKNYIDNLDKEGFV